MTTERGTLGPTTFVELLTRAAGLTPGALLVVSDGASERRVALGGGAVRVTTLGARAGRTLLEALLEHPELTPEQGQRLEAAAQASWSAGLDPLQPVLARPDVKRLVDACAAGLVVDELVETILWEGAEYELRAAPPPAGPPDRGALDLAAGAEDVLAQVRAKGEVWAALQARLGDPSRTVIRPGRAPDEEESDPLEDVLLAVVPEGGLTLAEALLNFRLAGPDVLVGCQTAARLAEEGRLVVEPEPPPPSSERRQALAREDVARIEPLLPALHLPAPALRRLARAHEALGDGPRAVDAWARAADALAAQPPEALEALREAVRLAPGCPFARERLAEALAAAGQADEAAREWAEAARRGAALGLRARVVAALRRATALAPHRPELTGWLADALVSQGRGDEAAAAWEALAGRLEGAGAHGQATAAWQALARLSPGHPDAGVRARRAYVRQGWARAVGVAAAVVVVAAAAGAFTLRASAAARRDDDATVAAAVPLAMEGRHDEARARVEARRASGRGDPARLARLAEAVEAARHDDAADRLARAAAVEGAGKVLEASQAYRRLEEEFPGSPAAKEAAARLIALDLDEKQAARAAEGVAAAARGGQVAQALTQARELLRRQGRTQAAKALQLPLEVRSAPPGAAVQVNGQRAGTTPCVVWLPQGPVALEVAGQGTQVHRATIDATSPEVASPLTIELQRAVRWRVDTLGPLLDAPWASDEGIVIGGTDQRVRGVAWDGQPRWTVRLAPFAHAAGPPVGVGDVVVVVEAGPTGGRALALEPRTGALRWERPLEGEDVRAVGPLGDGVVTSTAAGRLVLLGPDGEPRWRADLGAPLALPAAAGPEHVAAVTADGRAHLVDARGAVAPLPAPGRVVAPPGATPQGWLVATDAGELCLLGRQQPQPVWRRRLPEPLSAAATLADGLVLAPAGRRLLALDPATGAVRWERDLGAALGPPVARQGRVFVAAADGALHALGAARGDALWVARSGGPIRGAPVARRGLVLVAAEDGALSAVVE
ncbi:MAG: PQQ-binding-like beta-propeller repeat protein [Planctomycetes bacterium]|nr:PQQ-binding-like beta-propeller repeat protein [Planctomycetota bacterium]